MDIKQLSYFLHLASTGSVSQSAKVLGLSQPSLSRQIQQLEDALQAPLFHRHHRPMQLTDAGAFLMRHIEQPLAELEQAMALTCRFGDGRQNRLVIGSVVSVLYGLLPEIIAELRQGLSYHDTADSQAANGLTHSFTSSLASLDIKVIEMNFHQQITALKSGEIDVGFGRMVSDDPLISQTFLRDEPYLLAVSKWHPLVSQIDWVTNPTASQNQPNTPVPLTALAGDTLILYHKTPSPQPMYHETDPLLQMFEQARTMPKNTLRVRDIQVALAMVAANEGVTIVPESLHTVRTEQVRYLPLNSPAFSSPMYINRLAHNPIPHLDGLHSAIIRVYARHGIQLPSLQDMPHRSADIDIMLA